MTTQKQSADQRSVVTTSLLVLTAVALVCVVAGTSVLAQPPDLQEPDEPTDVAASDGPDRHNGSEPLEAAHRQSVPEPGDEYFEAAANDGSWVSYINPRDEYRNPYLGDGSGKLCVTLLNERGEPIVGESVPNTTVTIPTGESIEWHTHADPLTVEYPLTETSVRPLDADQFGTDEDLPQGDGYLDAHCIEVHGLPEDGAVEYGEVDVDGEYADWIDTVGYLQVEGEAWDSTVDPLEDAVSYEEAGGGWSYEPNASHGQVVAVLQLDPPAEAYTESTDDDEGDDGNSTAKTDRASADPAGQDADVDPADSSDGGDGSDDPADGDPGESLPGFGVPVALGSLVFGFLITRRRG